MIKIVEFLFLIKVDFFLLQAAQFDKSINLFCLIFLTLEFLFTVYFLTLTQQVSIVTYNQAIFFNNRFDSFDLITLSDLNSNPNILVEIFLVTAFS